MRNALVLLALLASTACAGVDEELQRCCGCNPLGGCLDIGIANGLVPPPSEVAPPPVIKGAMAH